LTGRPASAAGPADLAGATPPRPPYPSTGSDRQDPAGVLVIQVSTGALLFIARQTSLWIGMWVRSAAVALRIASPRAGPIEMIGCDLGLRAPP